MDQLKRTEVVGFGVGGAAAAVMLAQAGHSVTILERAPSLGPVGVGRLLQPSGQAVLQRIGLLELDRDTALPLMMRVPPLRREMERVMAGVRLGFPAGSREFSALSLSAPSPDRGRDAYSKPWAKPEPTGQP